MDGKLGLDQDSVTMVLSSGDSIQHDFKMKYIVNLQCENKSIRSEQRKKKKKESI